MIRVFIGAPPAGLDAEAQAVVAHSLTSRTSRPVEITWLSSDNPLWFGWDARRWVTPFSGYRFGVPHHCGFTGRAIYLDCDMIVLNDLAQLWDWRLQPGKVIAARGGWRLDVMLIDCAAVKEHMLPIEELRSADGFTRQSYYFREHENLIEALGSSWDCLDGENLPLDMVNILHYTGLNTQPSYRHAAKRLAAQGRQHWNRRPQAKHRRPDVVELFERELEMAIRDGVRPVDFDIAGQR